MRDFDDMTPIEVCEALNSGHHALPIIMRHGKGYDVYWSVGRGIDRYCESRKNLSFQEAIRTFKKFVLHAEGEQ